MTRKKILAFYVPQPDRGIVALTGADARSFLQGLITNDMAQLAPDRALYAGLLTPQGKFLHDFMVVAQSSAVWLDCERARADDLIRQVSRFKLRADVALSDQSASLRVATVFGGDAVARLGLDLAVPGHAKPLGQGVAYIDPRLSTLGARVILPAETLDDVLTEAGLTRAPTEHYERLRLDLGVPDGSRDFLVEKTFLLEGNVEALHGVDFSKGCYIGQETTARQKHRGQIRKRLLKVVVEGPLPPPGAPIMLGDKEAGTMRSGLDGAGLAMLRLELVEQAKASGVPLLAGESRIRPMEPDWL